MAFLPRRLIFLLLLVLLSTRAQAQARFDLPGPKIDVRVTRAGVSLPVAAVPNLQPGDQIWLHPDLPPSQSVHYLLIAAFLRGTTNPPPDDWFIRIETWKKDVREEGVTITVPAEAQQAVLFLAPETGGDFTTLRSAVKGRPGIFVRASQDLNEAGFEQARIEKYLAEMKRANPADPADIQLHSNLLARTLSLRPNPDCFKRPLDQQYSCLTQTGSQSLLDDGHSQSLAAALSNGPSSDLINQASYTQLAGAGVYSAYVGAIVDLVRLTSGLHTAKYQYIPAIAFPGTDGNPQSLSLRLNTAPSFNNPKSVIVIGLPAVQASVLPPLRPVEPSHISCLQDPSMVVPIEGAPLVFSTTFAHDLILHLNTPSTDIPILPDAFLGGIVLDPHPSERHELPLNPPAAPVNAKSSPTPAPQPTPVPPIPGAPVSGTITGMWGFDHFSGPTVFLQSTPAGSWHIVGTKPTPADLIAGHPNHLQLLSTGTACVQSIDLQPGDQKVEWKLAKSEPTPEPQPAADQSHTQSKTSEVSTGKSGYLQKPADSEADKAIPSSEPRVQYPVQPTIEPIDLTLTPPQAATPGSIHLAIQQFAQKTPDQLALRIFSEPARIEALRIHAGDTTAELTGTSLDQVRSLAFSVHDNPLTYTPEPRPADASDSPTSITLVLPDGAKPAPLKPGEKLSAAVQLRDDRTLDIAATVLPPRPTVTLLSERVIQPAPSPIQLGPTDLPLGAQLTFFLKSPSSFPRTEQVEIASPDDSLHTTLSIAAGTLILENSHTVLATFDPLKTFGPSTFGPFRVRAVAPPSPSDPTGTPGGWLPLATILRLPTLTALHCPSAPTADCTLTGTSLYLIDSLSANPAFTSPTSIPEGFVDSTLTIPHPAAPPSAASNATPASALTTVTFYLRLRDDPTTPHAVTLPLQTDGPPAPHPTPKPKPATPPPPQASLARSRT